MSGSSWWGTTPPESIAQACARRGAGDVVAGCIGLLHDDHTVAVVAPGLIAALAGPQAVRYLDAPTDQRYWLRVWGARGLLWALGADGAPAADDAAVIGAVVAALGDEHWRVREMAAKVVARYRMDQAQPRIAGLLTDATPRVRIAAARALRLLSGG
jgi:HEAT repeat protein